MGEHGRGGQGKVGEHELTCSTVSGSLLPDLRNFSSVALQMPGIRSTHGAHGGPGLGLGLGLGG
jgi:hypothetical protein